MSQSLKTALKLAAMGAAISLAVGCAETGGVKEAQSAADAAKAEAAAAKADAAAAMAKAEEALAAANEAKETASQARGYARSAEFISKRNSKKIDRMFKKSMYK